MGAGGKHVSRTHDKFCTPHAYIAHSHNNIPITSATQRLDIVNIVTIQVYIVFKVYIVLTYN